MLAAERSTEVPEENEDSRMLAPEVGEVDCLAELILEGRIGRRPADDRLVQLASPGLARQG
jgi:hypothetical protein